MSYELHTNREATPSQMQNTRASRFPVELKAEIPEVLQKKRLKGRSSLYALSKSHRTETETSGLYIEVFLPQRCSGSVFP